MEAWGKRAEYIRSGLDTEIFWSNLEYVLATLPRVHVTLMVTFNALSITSFSPFLGRLLEWRERFHNEFFDSRITADFTYLRNPSFQAVTILPADYQSPMQAIVAQVENHSAAQLGKPWGFSAREVANIRRISEWMKAPLSPERLARERATFYRFFSEYDRRRGVSFPEIFPEMREFWDECRRLVRFHDGQFDRPSFAFS
jgi:hypothetical protein